MDRPRDLSRSALRAEIKYFVKKWAPRLALDQWALELRYDDDLEVEATCHARPRYEEATLTFNVERIQMISAHSRRTMQELVVHELVHCIAWPSSEAVVSRVARALIRTETASSRGGRSRRR